MNPPGRILEEDQPLSRSLLWRLQREFFDRQGVNASMALPSFARYMDRPKDIAARTSAMTDLATSMIRTRPVAASRQCSDCKY